MPRHGAGASASGSCRPAWGIARRCLGTPLHQGWYLLDTTSYGQVPGPDGKAGAQVGFNIPILLWSSPWTVLGGRIEPYVSQPVLFGDRAGTGAEGAGFYNTLAGAAIAWQLTPHLGASYLLGIYFPTSDKYAFASASSRQDFSLSYGDDAYSVTGHITYGNIFDHAARFGNGLVQRNSDYVNFEGTALRKIGKFEFGPVMIGSTDAKDSRKSVGTSLVNAFRKPIVLVPIVAVAFVLTGIVLPTFVTRSFTLMGQVAGGAGLFLTGLIVSAQVLKLDVNVTVQTLISDVAHPLLVAVLAWLFGVASLPAREAIVLAALPGGFFGVLFGLRFGMLPTAPGTTLIASTVLSGVTLSVAIYLTSGMGP